MKPITGIAVCCALAASGHAAAAPPSSVMNSRLLTRSPRQRPRAKSAELRPSALAVLRLMTSSSLVGCSTGKSAGFSPLECGRRRDRTTVRIDDTRSITDQTAVSWEIAR